MPYKHIKFKIKRSDDRRVKLTEADKRLIIALYPAVSQRKLAVHFGVSRSTIRFIVDPDALERAKQWRQENGGWSRYYDKEKHKNYTKNHRHYKQKLYNENKLI